MISNKIEQLVRYFIAILSVISLYQCNSNVTDHSTVDRDVASELITSHSRGVIDISDNIEIYTIVEIDNSIDQGDLNMGITLSPKVEGKVVLDGNRLIFTPSSPLKYDTEYSVSLNMGTLFSEVKSESFYKFKLKTIRPNFSLKTEELYIVDRDNFSLSGEISINIDSNLESIKGVVSAQHLNRDLNIEWSQKSKGIYTFTILNILKVEERSDLIVLINGENIGIDRSEESTITVPSLSEFTLLKHSIIRGDTPRLELSFSNYLNRSQDLEGLIKIADSKFEYSIQNNKVTVYLLSNINGVNRLDISKYIKDRDDKYLDRDYSSRVDFRYEKPLIKFIGKGGVVPSSKGLSIPFQAVNLNSVDISIIKIKTKSVPQFLQQNSITGGYNFRYVGKPVYNGKLELIPNNLNSDENLKYVDEWRSYHIKLDELIDIEPGAIYRVELAMKPTYSIYPCNNSSPIKGLKMEESNSKSESRYWTDPDVWNSEDDWYYSNGFYNWREQDNPEHPAYYSPDRKVTKNIIGSNIGIIAKEGADSIMHVAITDIRTALPSSNIEVKLLNLQLDEIGSGLTNSEGLVSIDSQGESFLITAKKGDDIGYLKVNRGSSLQLSMFDLSGEGKSSGLKAYLYSERGVVRPGDSIFTSLIVQDKLNSLNRDHPIIFELYSPSNQLIDRQISKFSRGITCYRGATKESDPTGVWRLVARVGNIEFSKYIRVETVIPNRLKLNLTTEEELTGWRPTKANLSTKWLHGATSPNLKGRIEVTLSKGETKFSKFPNYSFDESVDLWSNPTIPLWDGVLDENGNIEFPIEIGDIDRASGKLNATFTVRVFEPGGAFSIAQFNRVLSPYRSYVGLYLPEVDRDSRSVDSKNFKSIDIATVSSRGEAIQDDIELKVYKVNWRWWWESGSDNLGKYVSGEYSKPLFSKNITTNKSGTFKLNIDTHKFEWGRYLISAKSKSGHISTSVIYINSYGNINDDDQGATMLALSLNRSKYSVGEDIKLQFPSSSGGKALITIENSTSVAKQYWVDCEDGKTTVTIEATPDMAPNIYLNITYVQPHNSVDSDKPIRLYGVVPVMVEDPKTTLHPEIEAPDNIRSGRPFTISVSEKSGIEMSYTLAIVDEGLLDLTNFQTPNPWRAIYSKEALGVRTWDMFDNVLGAYGGRVEQLMAIGGDNTLKDPSRQKVQRFKPIVEFLGPFILKAGEVDTHQITLPQYIGSLKVMVVAAEVRESSNSLAYGSCDKNIVVKDPLMVLATAPRTLGLNEKFDIPVSIFINDKSIKGVNVTVKCSGAIKIDGRSKIDLEVKSIGELEDIFKLKTTDIEGDATIDIEVRSKGEVARHTINISVTNSNSKSVISETKVLKEGESCSFKLSSDLDSNIEDRTTLELSSLLPLNLGRRLDYLIEYPHGCLEQTVSSIFPQIMLLKLGQLNRTAQKSAEENIKEGIEKLNLFQKSDGNFSYWPGSNNTNEWGAIYAAHALIEAKAAGFSVPQSLIKRWLIYSKSRANLWSSQESSSSNSYNQAYRLYVMALAGAPQTGAMNRLRENRKFKGVVSWLLASAYAEIGRKEVAEQLVDRADLEVKTSQDSKIYTFGSDVRNRAILLNTLTLIGDKITALHYAKEISENLCSSMWMNTQATSFALISIANFNSKLGGEVKGNSAILTIDGKERSIDLDSSNFEQTISYPNTQSSAEVKSSGNGTIFATRTTSGVAINPDIKERGQGVKLNITYRDRDGKLVDITSIDQGDDFVASIEVVNLLYMPISNLALTVPIPSGWEILNSSAEDNLNRGNYIYQDVRDSKVLTYFKLESRESKLFNIRLTASYSGEFTLPSIICESMYDERISANISGGTVNVVKDK